MDKNSKLRPLYIAKILYELTDEDHCLSTPEIISILESEYGILARCGLHCAPDAHRALGTFPKGTVRFSFSPATTESDVLAASDAVSALA